MASTFSSKARNSQVPRSYEIHAFASSVACSLASGTEDFETFKKDFADELKRLKPTTQEADSILEEISAELERDALYVLVQKTHASDLQVLTKIRAFNQTVDNDIYFRSVGLSRANDDFQASLAGQIAWLSQDLQRREAGRHKNADNAFAGSGALGDEIASSRNQTVLSLSLLSAFLSH